MANIAKPVGGGRKAENLPKDVLTIKHLLNNHAKAVGYKRMREDGEVDQALITAIGMFQHKVLQIKPTSRVDPGSPTMKHISKKVKEIDELLNPGMQIENFVQIDGKWVGLTKAEYAAHKKKIISGLRRGPVLQMKIAVAAAKAEWEYFDDLLGDQWFVGFFVKLSKMRVFLPPKSLIDNAVAAYKSVEAALGAGDLYKFHDAYGKAEPIVNKALDEMRSFREDMIDGGGNWVTGLTFTKTASFTFCAVFAGPAAGAALGTGVVASAMIGGAAVAATETASGEIGNWSAGKDKWTVGGAIKKTVIDASIGAVIGFFAKGGSGGTHVVESLLKRLLPKVASQAGFKLLSTATLRRIVVFFMTEGSKKALEDAVKDLGKLAKNDPKMTVEKFLDNIAVNFLKGAAMGPIGKVIEKVSKNAAKNLDPKDRQKIRDLVRKELKKQKVDDAGFVAVWERSMSLAEKTINDSIGKSLDGVLDAVVASWKGPMSPAALEKKLREKMMEDATSDRVVKAIAKDLKEKMEKANKKKK